MLSITLLPALAFASLALAAPAPAQLDTRTVVTSNNALPGGFVRVQDKCYKNAPLNNDGLLFKGNTMSDPNLTQAKCAQFCYDNGWTAAGISNARNCYCGASSDLERSSTVNSNLCNARCSSGSGPGGKICGGDNVLTVFTTTQVKPTPVTPAPVPANMYPAQVIEGYPAWQFKAQCNVDSVDNRLLALAFYDSTGMTWQKCVQACESKGNNLAGIEYGGECYCGEAGEFNAKRPANSNQCTTPCPGNSNQLCGGSNALSIIYRGGVGATP